MIIQVDEDGKSVIEQFCDISLKLPGKPLQNLKLVNQVLAATVIIPKPKKSSAGKSGKTEPIKAAKKA